VPKQLSANVMEAGRRASDIVNTYLAHRTFDELRHKWLAIKLADGDSDGTIYDSKRDAVRHQANEFHCAYVSFLNLLGGSTPRDMAIFLQFNRDAYDAGFRLPDPDDVHGGPDIAPTSTRMDYVKSRLIIP